MNFPASTTFEGFLLGKCRSKQLSIILPEGDDPRVLIACKKLLDSQSCKKVAIIGNVDFTKAQCIKYGIDLNLEDPRFKISGRDFPNLQEQAGQLFMDYLKKKSKPVSEENVHSWSSHPANQAASLLHHEGFHAALGGCVYSTAVIIRAALQGIGLKEGIKTISGSFAMVKPTSGSEIRYMFGDCGVVIDPTVEQLVDIASETVKTAQQLFPDQEPKVAFLSFSTKGSASHPFASKMAEAADKFQQANPHMKVDGELQFDAAIDDEIGQRKSPNSPVAGKANCFIFPDLDAGNIAYKITQRLAGFQAFGPILQGTRKPYSDLSRGASAEDIFTSSLIAMLRGQD